MDRSTGFATWLLGLLSRCLIPDEPGTVDAVAEDAATADTYDDRNVAAWYLQPPV